MTGTTQTRDLLSKSLRELELRAKRILADVTEPMSADSEEQAVETEDDEVLLAQESLVVERIAAIRAAIARVDEGRYGICLKCGGTIAPARLAIIPETTQCISCVTERQN
jgi:DnaK suppressor protein